MIYLRMAWRNLWRKPIRTAITLGMIFFAVLLSTTMSSLQQGIWERMIGNMISAQTGLIQVQRAGYWEDKSLDDGFLSGDSLAQVIERVPHVESVSGRIDNFLLGASEDRSRAALVMTLHPQDQLLAEYLEGCLVDGEVPGEAGGCVLGERFANYLGVGPGDTLVMLGAGYRGAMAAGQSVIRGIADLRTPDLDSRVVYLDLPAAQELFAAEDLLTALVVRPDGNHRMETLAAELRDELGDRWAVMTWPEMMPEIDQSKQADTAGGALVLAILYLLIAFGILGTILMMTMERRYEFGVLVAVGMKRIRLTAVVILEGLLLAAAGTLLGLGAAIPLVGQLAKNPIPITGSLGEAYESYGLRGGVCLCHSARHLHCAGARGGRDRRCDLALPHSLHQPAQAGRKHAQGMRMLLSIAWRNVWRHRSRSLVVMTALALGLWAGNFMMGLSFGLYDQRLKNALRHEIGHLQVHHPDFDEDGLAELYIPDGPERLAELQGDDRVLAAAGRVVVEGGLIQTARGSGGVRIVGVDPVREAAVSELNELIVEGEWFVEGKGRQMLVGEWLADDLNIKVGSRPVLTVTDINGDFAGLKPRVVGIFRSGNTSFDRSRVIVLEEELRETLALDSVPGAIHEIAARIHEPREIDAFTAEYAGRSEHSKVESWKQVAPELELMIETSDQYFAIFIGIILFAVGLAVVNTMLMAVYDRVREIGMLMSVGMTTRKVFGMIVLETIFLMGAAVPVGLLLAWGTIVWLGDVGLDMSKLSEGYKAMAAYGLDPVVYPVLESQYYVRNVVLVLISALLASLIPAWAAVRLDPVTAIRKL